MVPVDGLGMHFDDPDQRVGGHGMADVPLGLHRFTLRVCREYEVNLLDVGEEP